MAPTYNLCVVVRLLVSFMLFHQRTVSAPASPPQPPPPPSSPSSSSSPPLNLTNQCPEEWTFEYCPRENDTDDHVICCLSRDEYSCCLEANSRYGKYTPTSRLHGNDIEE
ncbi:uncharacterized protein [Ptychodera flava]|uniref:uncharacterized protein n=1 Tax=Ptychodera flava TaxID=63121 RepID=UPI00396A9D95